eukprot:7963181-Pyramimonas_sp.AAC.1
MDCHHLSRRTINYTPVGGICHSRKICMVVQDVCVCRPRVQHARVRVALPVASSPAMCRDHLTH